jgi:hypothetical protein
MFGQDVIITCDELDCVQEIRYGSSIGMLYVDNRQLVFMKDIQYLETNEQILGSQGRLLFTEFVNCISGRLKCKHNFSHNIIRSALT